MMYKTRIWKTDNDELEEFKLQFILNQEAQNGWEFVQAIQKTQHKSKIKLDNEGKCIYIHELVFKKHQ